MSTTVSLDPATGEVLDRRYRLADRVGEGGMARVYRAEDLHLQRTVAVKIMRGAASELGSIERARSETTLLAGLNHHGLVTLYDASLSDQRTSYLVMEFVDGITLRELIARGPLDPTLAASIVADLAEALHVAHSAGVVHRDIKPSNVLLATSPVPGAPWRPKLADFGIAHMLDSARMTTPGLMVGTVAYLAPEQAEGAPPAPPADIYSLGIMLIEALAGARPFPRAEGLGELMVRLSTAPPVPETLPEQWRQLLRGMTARRPDDRPTALEVATTASRIAGGADAATAASALDTSTAALDLPTAAVAARVAARVAAVSTQTTPAAAANVQDVTERTLLLPPVPPLPADLADPAPERSAGRQPIARGFAIGAVAAAVAVLLASAGVMFGLWSGAATAEPAPSPSPTPSSQVTPAPTATPETTDTAGTADTSEAGTSGTTGSSSGSSGSSGGSGGSNPNSGPGNNNAGGNGNGNGNN